MKKGPQESFINENCLSRQYPVSFPLLGSIDRSRAQSRNYSLFIQENNHAERRNHRCLRLYRG